MKIDTTLSKLYDTDTNLKEMYTPIRQLHYYCVHKLEKKISINITTPVETIIDDIIEHRDLCLTRAYAPLE